MKLCNCFPTVATVGGLHLYNKDSSYTETSKEKCP